MVRGAWQPLTSEAWEKLKVWIRFRFGGLPELYVYREPPPADEEVEEPSSPPIHAEARWPGAGLELVKTAATSPQVSGMATAEDGPDLPPQVLGACTWHLAMPGHEGLCKTQ